MREAAPSHGVTGEAVNDPEPWEPIDFDDDSDPVEVPEWE